MCHAHDVKEDSRGQYGYQAENFYAENYRAYIISVQEAICLRAVVILVLAFL